MYSSGAPDRVSVICLMHAPDILANFINLAIDKSIQNENHLTDGISKHLADIFLVLCNQISVSAIEFL